jgi:serine/threonine protein kinase
VTDHLVVGGQLGNYLIDAVVGRGGMSVVYRAKHSRLGMSVALKVLAPELSTDDAFRERFLREAQMAAMVDHPNVIPIHDMGVHEQSLYIVMRYVAGGDLKDILAASGPLDPAEAVALLMPVALALDAAHAHGLIHRDVKPANILIQRSAAGDTDHVYLTDFGIAKSTSSMTGLTRTGAVIGTIDYMAPEQLEGGEVSARTDVYALGVTFYECITARIPFRRELAELGRPRGPAESVASLRPVLPREFDDVLAKALSLDPTDRYVTCGQFLRACSYVTESRASASDAAPEAVARTELSAEDPAEVVHGPSPQLGASPREPALAQRAGLSGGEEVSTRPDRRGADGPRDGTGLSRRGWYVGVLAAVVAAAVAVGVLTSGTPTGPTGRLASAPLQAVPTNHVTGSGNVTVRLVGNKAALTLTTQGLDDNAALVHAMHIHAGGKGVCPPASAARMHNGHLTISTTDGIPYYGPPVQALTTYGDTSVASILVFSRFLSGGTLRYTRTITLPPDVANSIRENNAVIVVHGIDYDHTGIYTGVLDRSELNHSLPATATAPALCGRLVGAQAAAAGGGRLRGRAHVYTASLNAAPQISSESGAFICHAPEGIGAATVVPSIRRRTERRVGRSA